eukprot:CAMPEP_0178923358 /NCGR_PEP_ID=MMETSP0786-20121207/16674_1 /TAXON_ID=186022 /ORGANISM="Thalassionema frauenfeldii, Strain CCMP 1798" /LENGTH=283 /DNA_ID=CAMNT_0020597843 /DNA_START=215 /DNA_END=1067 /DNA_ORIENTATION=+
MDTKFFKVNSARISEISLLASSNFEDEITAASKSSDLNDDIVAAAAAATQEQCQLIGTKSLGVDYGLSRTGVAITVGYNPKPIDIIKETNSALVVDSIVQYATSMQVSQIVLGLPLEKNGTECEQANLTRVFGEHLAIEVIAKLGPQVPVLLWDERYTSKEAAARAHSKNPDDDLYGTLDADAACIILETYYKNNGEGAERIQVNKEQHARSLAAYEQFKIKQKEEEQSILNKRLAKMEKMQNLMERSKKLEEEMRANGTLGLSNKKKRKKKIRKRNTFIRLD